MVDIFTKYCWAEPIIGKDTKYIKKAITECMEKMGGKPKMIYHDAETTFTGDFLQQWLVQNKIKPITTLTHAPVAERTIRTIKNLLYPRVRHFKSPWWKELPKGSRCGRESGSAVRAGEFADRVNRLESGRIVHVGHGRKLRSVAH
jgi:hypothetical protein